MLSRDDVLRRFASVRQAPLAGGHRAPHKPLFLLYLLGTIQKRTTDEHGPLVVPYSVADERISPLIAEFGPPSRTRHRAAMPFYHLDASLWHIQREDLQPRHAVLRDQGAQGEFDPDVMAALQADPSLLIQIAWRLLVTNFPETYFIPICAAVGLDLVLPVEPAVAPRAARSARFRDHVIRAYDHACAFCGYAGMEVLGGIGLQPVGLAAAHVHWHAYHGPDVVTNGMALCEMHHRLFDRGLLGINEQRRVIVSPNFSAKDDRSRALVLGLELREPRTSPDSVADTHFAWHRQQVFRM